MKGWGTDLKCSGPPVFLMLNSADICKILWKIDLVALLHTHSPKTIIQEHSKVHLPLTQAQQSKQILLQSNIIFMILVLKCKFYAAFFVNLYVHQIFFKMNLLST